MAQQTVDIGSIAGDGTGDPLRDAFTKINENFTELYSTVSNGGLTYGNVQSNVNGITFNVTRLAESYTADPVLAGSGQTVGNVYKIIGTSLGGATPFNDVLLTVTSLGNVSLGSVGTVTALGVPVAPVLKVNGQTGNVNLTVTDISGAASKAYVDSSIAANLANVASASLNSINANVSAANLKINNHESRILTLESNSASQAVQINNLVTVKANVSYVDSVVDNALGNAAVLANLNAVNANVAAANIKIQTIDANLGLVIGNLGTLSSNASSQAIALNVLSANAATQSLAIANLVSNTTFISLDILNLWSNASAQANSISTLSSQIISTNSTINTILANIGVHSIEIDSLQSNVSNILVALDVTNANITAANLSIIALRSNAAMQELTLDNLIANAGVQGTALNLLTANSVIQANQINDLVSNSSAQSMALDVLTTNAAIQHTQIVNLTSNLNIVNQNLSANIEAANAAIVSANINLKSYTDDRLNLKANVNNLVFTGNFSNGNLIILGSNVTTANSNVRINVNREIVHDSARVYIKGQSALRFVDQPVQDINNPRHIVRAWTYPHPEIYLPGNVNPVVSDYERAAISFSLNDANTTANISSVFIETFDWTGWNTISRTGSITHRYQFSQGNIFVPVGGNLVVPTTSNIRFGDGSWQTTAVNIDDINSNINLKSNIESPTFTGNVVIGNLLVSNVTISSVDSNTRIILNQELVSNVKRMYFDGQTTLRFTNQGVANIGSPRHFIRLWGGQGPLKYNVPESTSVIDATDYERVALSYGLVDSETTSNISAFFIETTNWTNFNAQSRTGAVYSRYQFSQGNIIIPSGGSYIFGDGTRQSTAANVVLINQTFNAVNNSITTANLEMKDYVDSRVNVSLTTGNVTFSDTTISTQNGTTSGIILDSAGNGEIAMLDYVGINNTNPGYWVHIGDGTLSATNNTGNISIDYSNGLGTSRGSTILGYAWWDAGGNGNNNRGIGAHSHFGLYKNDDTFSTKFIEFEYSSGNVTIGNLTVNGNTAFTMANYQNWTSNVSSISAALNQLAARLKALGG